MKLSVADIFFVILDTVLAPFGYRMARPFEKNDERENAFIIKRDNSIWSSLWRTKIRRRKNAL